MRAVLAALLMTFVIVAQPVRAGLFDDNEARRQVKDLSIQTNDRVDILSRAQIDLANQIQALREENARLHGQVEALTYELESTKKRQQDFYVDLDSRLRKFEGVGEGGDAHAGDADASPDSRPTPPSGTPSGGEPARKPASDPVAESRDYETALNYFRANKV